jgi:hypothetical protein
MNPRRLSALLVLSVVPLTAIGTVRADDEPAVKSNEKQPANICIVSGEHLQPGEIVTYVYKEPGHPDRTLRFCCHKCLARFKADPDRYLKKLDQPEPEKKDTPPDRSVTVDRGMNDAMGNK